MNFIWMDRQRFSFLFPRGRYLRHQRERDALLERATIGAWFLLQTHFLFMLANLYSGWHTNCIIIVYQNVICVEICKSLLTKDRDAEHRHKERKYCKSGQRKKITIHYARNICTVPLACSDRVSGEGGGHLTRRLNGCSLYSISR